MIAGEILTRRNVRGTSETTQRRARADSTKSREDVEVTEHCRSGRCRGRRAR